MLRRYARPVVNYLTAQLLAQHIFFSNESDAEWAAQALDVLCDAELVTPALRAEALHTWQEIRDRRIKFLEQRRSGAARSSSAPAVKPAPEARGLTAEGGA